MTCPCPAGVGVPAALDASLRRHAGAAWADALEGLTRAQLHRWGLGVRGAPLHGMVVLMVPMWLPEGGAAVLKMQPVDEETAGEPVALRAWAGRGAVRLLAHDASTGAMLLEALDAGRDLGGVELDSALMAVGGLLERVLGGHRPQAVGG